MSYQVFARKYRPRTFDDVLGQDHVVRTLRNAIAQNRLAHAYLFVGPRGTGKTSTARILSKALNCPGGPKADFDPDDPICVEIAEGRSMDVLEIDGASNNGIEQVRDLRDTVQFAPMSGQFRIVYIDEVHMLSVAAFNGLLKVLEEPPPHAKFIFATTDPQKVLPTIISRCQRFDLRRIPDIIIADHLLDIAEKEGLTLTPAAAHAVARGAEGGMRDAQSMLDQLVAFCGGKIDEEDVLNIFGFTAHETIASLSTAILEKNTPVALEHLHQQTDQGKDLTKLLSDLIAHLRNLLVHKVDPQTSRDLPPPVLETLQTQSGLLTTERLLNLIDQFAEVDGRMKWASNKRLYLEIGVIKAIRSLEEVLLSDVIVTLQSAREQAASAPASAAGVAPVIDAPAPPPSAPAPAPAPAEPTPPPAPAPPIGAGDPPPAAEDGSPLLFAESVGAAPTLADNGPLLWEKTLEEIQASKPLLHGWARQGVLVEKRADELLIGFAPGSRMAKDQLARPAARAAIEEIIAALSGTPLRLSLEIREDIEPPAPPPRPEPEPTPAPPRAEPPRETAAPPPVEEAAAAPVPALDESAFYDDPLIAEALKIFEAKITSVTPAKKQAAKK